LAPVYVWRLAGVILAPSFNAAALLLVQAVSVARFPNLAKRHIAIRKSPTKEKEKMSYIW
jgi:hypothetical protein